MHVISIVCGLTARMHTFSIPVVQAHRVNLDQHLILTRCWAVCFRHAQLIQTVLAREPLLDLLRRRHL